MKILFFLTDFASYKTYLDLKNYLYNNNIDVELDYYCFNYTYANPYKADKDYLLYPDNHLTSYMEKDYTTEKYGFIVQYTSFMESLMSVLANYVNNKDDLLNINNGGIWLNNVCWFKEFNNTMNKDTFIEQIEDIPKADLYLISSRFGYKNFATLTVEVVLALYLIRNYNSKVFIGGGSVNEPDNVVVELINAIGREYVDNKLEYLIGTIGANISNYIKGYSYQNARSPIERHVLPLDINSFDKELKTIMDNKFVIELVRGCKQACPYCVNSYINKYDAVDIKMYDEWFKHLSKFYPNTTIYLYAPEVNTDSEYFNHVLDYLIENNVQNPLYFYINIIKITNEQIEKSNQLNICQIDFGLDLLFDNVKYKNYGDLNLLHKKINMLQNNLKKSTKLNAYMVANAPKCNLLNWDNYQDIYVRYHNIITYSEFALFLSTPIAKYPEKYGLRYIYYNNRYGELSNIKDVISKVPVMYFRKDINRKELVNNKYNILVNMRNHTMKGIMCGFENKDFLKSLINQIIPDYHLIDRHDALLDKTMRRVI